MSDDPVTAIKRELLSDARKKVDDYVYFENASQQRSLTVGGFFLASATALVAGVISIASDDIGHTALTIAGIVAAVLFYTAALLCFFSALPGIIHTSGNTPDWWEWVLRSHKTAEAILEEQIDDIKTKIARNKVQAEYTRRLFRFGAYLGLITPLFSSLVWIILQHYFRSIGP